MASKLLLYYRKLSAVDFCRKVFYTVKSQFEWNIFRRIKAFYYFKTSGISLGKNVRIHGLPYNIKVGAGTMFYDNCIFEFGDESETTIGSDVVFSYGVLFCCHFKISLGKDVQIGEFSSIRDTTHRHDQMDKPMKYSNDLSMPVSIADNVWIGRGCLILPGTIIEEGVVVAANSVVKGKLEKNGIYGGAPAKLIKYRQQTTDLSQSV